MTAAQRQQVRNAIDARPKRIRGTICPNCGKDQRWLNAETGWCQSCTNEHRRGEPVTPHDHRTFA